MNDSERCISGVVPCGTEIHRIAHDGDERRFLGGDLYHHRYRSGGALTVSSIREYDRNWRGSGGYEGSGRQPSVSRRLPSDNRISTRGMKRMTPSPTQQRLTLAVLLLAVTGVYATITLVAPRLAEPGAILYLLVVMTELRWSCKLRKKERRVHGKRTQAPS